LVANGGWYGSAEEWQRLEAPLLTIDPILEEFARINGLRFTKNVKDSPERSLRWGDDPSCLMQIYLESDAQPSWNFWLCCYQDRDGSRYWRRGFAVQGEAVDAFRDELASMLEESFNRVETWRANPDQLEFATTLAPMPRS
jgi:hypothetical protein